MKLYLGGKIKKKGRVNIARKSRQYNFYNNVYHIMTRGNNKICIFNNKEDKKQYLKILKQTKQKFQFEIYAYCLMNNHVHLVIKDSSLQISQIMKKINLSYAKYFNEVYNRTGHLFQGRYLSKMVQEEGYFKQLCRYIHKNPEKANIESMSKYTWSSYNDYVKYLDDFVNIKVLLELFSKDKNQAIEQFINFHKFNSRNIDYGIEEIEFEMNTKISDEELTKYIKKVLEIDNIASIKNLEKSKRNQQIIRLLNIKGITILQLARVLGVNRKIIERLCSFECPFGDSYQKDKM